MKLECAIQTIVVRIRVNIFNFAMTVMSLVMLALSLTFTTKYTMYVVYVKMSRILFILPQTPVDGRDKFLIIHTCLFFSIMYIFLSLFSLSYIYCISVSKCNPVI